MDNKIILFQEKQVRREWHKDEWYFSIIDVIEILTENSNPSRYWQDLKRKSEKMEGQLYDFIVKFKFLAQDGKMRPTECANTEELFRIIMSVPSPKAEPFKLWLAQTGKERVEEIENPELGFERLKNIYKAKGYSEEWIDVRLKSIDVRKKLTDEWHDRGVKEGIEYAILTAEISKATFGMTPSEYQQFKKLERQNVRDHMSDLELIFTMLGEGLTNKLAIDADAQGFDENARVAKKGGKAAGEARLAAEKETGVKVITPNNFLKQIEGAKKKSKKIS